MRSISKKPITKKGLVEWLKVKALSSSPSTAKKEKKEKRQKCHYFSSSFFLIQNWRTGEQSRSCWGWEWYQWEGRRDGEREKEGEYSAKTVHTYM
jgi:hypothetical protein